MSAATGAPPTRSSEDAWLRSVSVVPHPWSSGTVLHLRRAWPRNAGHVLLEYVAAAPAGTPSAPVVGQWQAGRGWLHRVAGAMEVAAGPGSAALLPDRGILLHAAGADRRLPVLRRLLADPGAELVVHRPERRAVVRLDRGAERRWIKLHRPERVASLLARTAWLAPLGAAGPQLLDARAVDGTTTWADLPGVPLGDLLGDTRADEALRGTGALLRRLHDLPIPADGPAHGAAQEIGVLAQWMGHLHTFFPVLHVRVGALLAWAAELLEDTAGATVRRVTLHRDLHDGQLLVAPSGVRILDPDTVAAGEPELDLGNLLAHLRLAAAEGRCGRARAAAAFGILLDAYGRAHVDRGRLRAYTAAALLRLVAVHAFRPASTPRLPEMVEEAGRLLSREDALGDL